MSGADWIYKLQLVNLIRFATIDNQCDSFSADKCAVMPAAGIDTVSSGRGDTLACAIAISTLQQVDVLVRTCGGNHLEKGAAGWLEFHQVGDAASLGSPVTEHVIFHERLTALEITWDE